MQNDLVMERLVAPKMEIVPPSLTVVKKVDKDRSVPESPRKRKREISENAPPMLMPPPQTRYIKMGDHEFF